MQGGIPIQLLEVFRLALDQKVGQIRHMNQMTAKVSNDRKITELLDLAGISTADNAARRWLRDALVGAQSIAAGEPRPNPTKHNAPLTKIERTAADLIEAIDALKLHPHAYLDFWSYPGFGPVFNSSLERPLAISNLKNIRTAAQRAGSRKTGRPPDRRKQHIVNLALAFWTRFSCDQPSSDVNNAFLPFAERFFELSTGLSTKARGHGIDRQIRVALRRLTIEQRRTSRLNETHR